MPAEDKYINLTNRLRKCIRKQISISVYDMEGLPTSFYEPPEEWTNQSAISYIWLNADFIIKGYDSKKKEITFIYDPIEAEACRGVNNNLNIRRLSVI